MGKPSHMLARRQGRGGRAWVTSAPPPGLGRREGRRCERFIYCELVVSRWLAPGTPRKDSTKGAKLKDFMYECWCLYS